MSDAKPAIRTFVPLAPSNMLGQEFARNVWCITAENSVAAKDVQNPALYSQIASKLRIGDHIELMPDDGTWFARLIVRNVDRSSVKVGLLQLVEFEDAAVPSVQAGPDLLVKFRGRAKFGVIRVSDGAVLHENLQTRAEAMAWALEHERNFAA